MSRLTQTLRNEIIKNATEGAFQDEYKAIAEQRKALDMDIYRHFISEDDEKLARKLKPGFVSYSNSFRCRIARPGSPGSYSYEHIQLDKDRPMMANMSYNNTYLDDAKLVKRFHDVERKKQVLDDKVAELTRQVTGLVNSFSTVKALREAWPEGDQFIPKIEPGKTFSVPAIIPAAVTNALKMAGVFKGEAVPA